VLSALDRLRSSNTKDLETGGLDRFVAVFLCLDGGSAVDAGRESWVTA